MAVITKVKQASVIFYDAGTHQQNSDMRTILLILTQLSPHGPSQIHLLLFFLFRQSALVLHSFLHLASDSDRAGHFGDERIP